MIGTLQGTSSLLGIITCGKLHQVLERERKSDLDGKLAVIGEGKL